MPKSSRQPTIGRCFSSRFPASPGCGRPPVRTPWPNAGQPPRQHHASYRLLRLVGKMLPTCADAVADHSGATEHTAIGQLCLHASTANHGGMRLYHGSSAHMGRTRDQKTTLCELMSSTGHQEYHARSTRSCGEGHQARRHRSQSTGVRNKAQWAKASRRTRGQMDPLHLAMMRAL